MHGDDGTVAPVKSSLFAGWSASAYPGAESRTRSASGSVARFPLRCASARCVRSLCDAAPAALKPATQARGSRHPHASDPHASQPHARHPHSNHPHSSQPARQPRDDGAPAGVAADVPQGPGRAAQHAARRDAQQSAVAARRAHRHAALLAQQAAAARRRGVQPHLRRHRRPAQGAGGELVVQEHGGPVQALQRRLPRQPGVLS